MIDIELLQKAISYAKNGKFNEAESIYSDLLKTNPDNFILLSAYGLLKFSQRNYKKASELFEEALNYAESPDVYNQLISSLFEIRNYPKAVEYAEKMYTLYPDDARAIAHKIKSLTQTGKLLDAEKLCVETLRKNPENSLLWFHLGFLKELIYCDDIQARECFKAASELGNQEADYNIAVSCQKLGEFEEAEKYYEKMLQKYPNDIDTITSLGMCYLTQRKFKEGYDLFFKRDTKLLEKTNNPWKPGDSIEEDIVIICEQGFGDHIQFIRYLPFLKAKRIQVAAPKSLVKLFEKNYPSIEFIDYDSINPQTQAFRITDLAYVLNLDFDNIPFSEGYLNVEPLEIKSSKPKVGLCWEAGSAGIRTMINRTVNIKLLEPILNLENIQVYSFQYSDSLGGNEKYPQIINLAKDFNDFYDTARALKAMDFVITVDTSVAHLAGALGVKTFLLLPYASDWRWFNDTKTTPWYKSVEIFKQTDHISWEEPIKNIIENF